MAVVATAAVVPTATTRAAMYERRLIRNTSPTGDCAQCAKLCAVTRIVGSRREPPTCGRAVTGIGAQGDGLGRRCLLNQAHDDLTVSLRSTWIRGRCRFGCASAPDPCDRFVIAALRMTIFRRAALIAGSVLVIPGAPPRTSPIRGRSRSTGNTPQAEVCVTTSPRPPISIRVVTSFGLQHRRTKPAAARTGRARMTRSPTCYPRSVIGR